MSAYTPGPWYAAPTTPENIAIITIEGQLICDPCPMSRADARLIAAAPELACLLSRLAGFAAHHASDSALAAGGRDLVADARALLARIEGAP